MLVLALDIGQRPTEGLIEALQKQKPHDLSSLSLNPLSQDHLSVKILYQLGIDHNGLKW